MTRIMKSPRQKKQGNEQSVSHFLDSLFLLGRIISFPFRKAHPVGWGRLPQTVNSPDSLPNFYLSYLLNLSFTHSLSCDQL